jgi:two-component system sensor histidine kinase UhpB
MIEEEFAMSLNVAGKDDQARFNMIGLYGVPFTDDTSTAGDPLQASTAAAVLFRNLIEQFDAITYVFEVGGGLRYISPQVAVLGGTPSNWLSQPRRHADLIHPDDRDEALAKINDSLNTGAPLCHEYRLLTANGSYAWYRNQAHLSEDHHQAGFTMHGMLLDISKYKEAELAALQVQQQLLTMAAAQDEVKWRERHRIAQDVHDELGGLLTCINAFISVCLERSRQRGDTPDPLLCDAGRMATEAINAVQNIATTLRPNALDAIGLWAAVDAALAMLSRRSGIACSSEIDPALARCALGADIEVALFRIVQEALTNITRHAAATQVSVCAQRTPAGLRLTVSDNGVGLRATGQRERPAWGVVGMRERATRHNGSLSLGPAAGGGTELVLELPLEADDGQ